MKTTFSSELKFQDFGKDDLQFACIIRVYVMTFYDKNINTEKEKKHRTTSETLRKPLHNILIPSVLGDLQGQCGCSLPQ